jgi:O-antigen ligase
MGPMNIGFGILFLFLLPKLFQRKSEIEEVLTATPGVRTLFRASLLLGSACVVSLLSMHFFPHSYAGHSPVLTFRAFEKLWYFLIPFMTLLAFHFHAGTSTASFRFLLRTWWGTTLLLLPVALIQFYTGWPRPQVIPTNPEHFHAILFLGHHLSVSSVLPFPTFTALAIAFGTYSRTGRIARFELLVGLSGILILFLSYARTAWLSIPIGLLLLFFRYLKPKARIASVLALVLALGVLSQTPAMKERIRNQMGIQDRVLLWKANLDFFQNRPLTGIGWLATQEMSGFYFKEKDPEHYLERFWGHAHSNYFEMLGGAGLLGLLTFLFFIGATLRLAIMTGNEADRSGQPAFGDLARGIGIALVLLHFNGLTNVTFWEGKVIHQQMLSLGLLLILRRILGGPDSPGRKEIG